MKTFLLLFLISAPAFAHQPVKNLECRNGQDFRGNFGVQLDPNAFDQGSGYFQPGIANISYEYSSASLICYGNTPEELNCIGYWFGTSGDIAQVHTYKLPNGKLGASFNTSKAYGDITVQLSCSLQ